MATVGIPSGFPARCETLAELLEIIRVLRAEVHGGRRGPEKFTFHVRPERFPFGLWFRGEGTYEQQLVPGAFRESARKGADGRGRKTYVDEPFVNNFLNTRFVEYFRESTRFDKLSLAQHYSVPTRLLDWTESLLVAIYFAVSHGHGDGKLFVLNAYALNRYSGMGHGSAYIMNPDDFNTAFRSELAFAQDRGLWWLRVTRGYPQFDWCMVKKRNGAEFTPDELKHGKPIELFDRPVAVGPNRFHQRMIVQGSMFVLFGGVAAQRAMADGLPRWMPIPQGFSDDGLRRRVLLKVTIPERKKQPIRDELYSLGVHEGTLFPEMERQRNTLERMGRIEGR